MKARTVRWSLGLVAAVLAESLLLSLWDPSPLVDSFFAQRVEREAIAVWQRRAIAADWTACRLQPDLCIGRIVTWPVTHLANRQSHYGDNASRLILWGNDEQVPRGVFTAVGMVRKVAPLGIEMVYLGTPDAPYGGTTWEKRFGLGPATRVIRLRDAKQGRKPWQRPLRGHLQWAEPQS